MQTPYTCPECESDAVVQTGSYNLWRCSHCGNWFDEEDFVDQPPAARRKPRRQDDEYDDYADY